ncbi:MAG: V-type ATPase subunit, partial [Chloroflexota bacterium]|nr:V-type ATPase subunit [Chloroflexota bacterium]
RETPYYDPLVHALKRYQVERNLFPLEAALDLDYRRKLWESMQQLTGNDYQQALRLIGPVIDMDNLLWAIRYRVYHQMSMQEIINYTLPFGYRVRDAHIRAIAAGEDLATVVRSIYPGLSTAVLGSFSQSPGAALHSLEKALNRRIVRRCRVAFSGDPFHIGLPVAYLLLHEHEIEDLTAVIEAKDSRLPLEMLKSVVDFNPMANQAERS